MPARIIMRTIPTPHSGSETSSRPDTSRQETLTPVQLSMFDQTTLPDTRNVISSPALADGPTPLDLQAGPMIVRSGPEAVRANHLARLGLERRSTIHVISGRNGFGSSESGALQSSLENRLRARLGGGGLTLWRMNWKAKITPSGRRLFQLALLDRSKSVTAFGFWPAPRAVGSGMGGGSNSRKAAIKRGRYVSGRQNPAFLAWLMMYPDAWVTCAASATPSSRKSRPNSSSQRKKPSMKSMLE